MFFYIFLKALINKTVIVVFYLDLFCEYLRIDSVLSEVEPIWLSNEEKGIELNSKSP